MSRDGRFGERFARTVSPGPLYPMFSPHSPIRLKFPQPGEFTTDMAAQSHVQTIVMDKRVTTNPKPKINFRRAGRDGFMTGEISPNGLALYRETAHSHGPCYDPQFLKSSTHPSEHYTNLPAPSRDQRFSTVCPTRSFLHVSSVSPGPKYQDHEKTYNLALTTNKPPSYFLGLKLAEQFLMQHPPVGRVSDDVGPGRYPKMSEEIKTEEGTTFVLSNVPVDLNAARFKYSEPPRHPFDKANKSAKVWMSETHAKNMPEFMARASPGPKYYVTNYDMANEEKDRRRRDRPRAPVLGGKVAWVP